MIGVAMLVSTIAGDATASRQSLSKLVGRWVCKGHFVRTGRALSATIDIRRDPATGSLIVRHEDVLPGTYKSLEVWNYHRDGRLRAAVSDPFSGVRFFTSPGFADGHLSWDSLAGEKAERFTYALGIAGRMQVDWSIGQTVGALELGDTLDCVRS